jgi:hypothetical protein
MLWTYWCEWEMPVTGVWLSREKMIADLREAHNELFEGDPDYEDFDKCVAENLYTFGRTK